MVWKQLWNAKMHLLSRCGNWFWPTETCHVVNTRAPCLSSVWFARCRPWEVIWARTVFQGAARWGHSLDRGGCGARAGKPGWKRIHSLVTFCHDTCHTMMETHTVTKPEHRKAMQQLRLEKLVTQLTEVGYLQIGFLSSTKVMRFGTSPSVPLGVSLFPLP